MSNEAVPAAIDALYVSVMGPDDVERDLQFQWMRVHPSDALALGNDQQSLAVQSSRMMSTYRKLQAERDQSKDGNVKSAPWDSPFFKASGIHIDLCDLFDPPLLSDAVPGMGQCRVATDSRGQPSAMKRVRNDEDTQLRSPEDTDHVDCLLSLLLDCAVFSVTNGAIATTEEARSELQLRLSPSKQSDLVGWSTHWFRDRINERVSELHDVVSFSELAVVTMIILAETFGSESVGRYILGRLAPSLLTTSESVINTRVRRRIQLLANSLLRNCSLQQLSKTDLYNLTSNTTGAPESEAMDELVCCIGEILLNGKLDS